MTKKAMLQKLKPKSKVQKVRKLQKSNSNMSLIATCEWLAEREYTDEQNMNVQSLMEGTDLNMIKQEEIKLVIEAMDEEVNQCSPSSVPITSDELVKNEPESFVVKEEISNPEPANTTSLTPVRKQRKNVAKEKMKLKNEKHKLAENLRKRQEKRARNPARHEENVAQLPDYSEISQSFNQKLSDTNLNDNAFESSDETQSNVTEISNIEAESGFGTETQNLHIPDPSMPGNTSQEVVFSSFDNDSASDAGTQDVHISDTSMTGDTSQAVGRSTNIDETTSETNRDLLAENEKLQKKIQQLEEIVAEGQRQNNQLRNKTASRNTVKLEIEIIEIDDDEQMEVKQECGQSNSDSSAENEKLQNKMQQLEGIVAEVFESESMYDETEAIQTSFTHPTEIEVETTELPTQPAADGAMTSSATSSSNSPKECKKPYISKKKLEKPHKSRKPDKSEHTYKCDQCSYTTNYAQRLTDHKRTHVKIVHSPISPISVHDLNECMEIASHEPKPPSNEQAPEQKATSTSSKKPHKCDRCTQSFSCPSQLKVHLDYHTGNRQFKCHICSYAAVKPSNLQNHMRTHSDEKPFKCDQCTYAGKLTVHIRTHTGEKPYKCDQCSFAAAKLCQLQQHIRTHTGEKPYKCPFCSYATAQSPNLKKHIRTHEKN